jgi:hypothetical protein
MGGRIMDWSSTLSLGDLHLLIMIYILSFLFYSRYLNGCVHPHMSGVIASPNNKSARYKKTSASKRTFYP